ncbi:MAG: aminomethyl-transferring glycine dehydrogenase subunit GcvPB, partial [Cyanobacteria bacterium HKST-UBA06]|nr:aminomethyl-transferring glycine dehydrogenase subunit GcvPB [Cyanobacteria bacterium HKST-UBA06]
SQLNHSIDNNFYPLGSCSMKYNPKICDWVGNQPAFNLVHPEVPQALAQGTLGALYTLQAYLKDLTGFCAVSLQPAAGAHGELAGMMMIRAYHQRQGNTARTEVLVPDSAHGTNPASAAMCGFDVVEIKSNERGLVDLNALRAALSDRTAAIMLTNPNTVGLFEEDILSITQMVHEAGGLCYYDGANLNAIMGRAKVAHMGFDVMHLNTHKTFATPHGGGGPGSGPVAANEKLEPFLPKPTVEQRPDGTYWLNHDRPDALGQLKLFYGNTEVLLRALAYLVCYGGDGLREVSEKAVLNANYLKARLKETYHEPFTQTCMHEFILTSRHQRADNKDINTMALAKRLMDYGFHPPTVYFPLIIPEIMMIEPTETESKETLDRFVQAMVQIADEAKTQPELVLNAPHTTPVKRVDEVAAVKQLDLNYFANYAQGAGN